MKLLVVTDNLAYIGEESAMNGTATTLSQPAIVRMVRSADAIASVAARRPADEFLTKIDGRVIIPDRRIRVVVECAW